MTDNIIIKDVRKVFIIAIVALIVSIVAIIRTRADEVVGGVVTVPVAVEVVRDVQVVDGAVVPEVVVDNAASVEHVVPVSEVVR